jgi:hypothetical protein
MVQILDPALHPEPDESRRCQFCSYEGKLTREHLWPGEFKRLFPEAKSVRHERFDATNPPVPRTWQGPAFESTVTIDCAMCNNKHLRRIEREAAIWIFGMARGVRRPTPLHLETQRKLAAFALRMTSVAQYTGPDLRPIPRSHREHLVIHRTPPPAVEVWLSYYAGDDWAWRVQTTPQGISAGPGQSLQPGPNAYYGFLRVGHVVLQIAARTDGLPYPFRPRDPDIYIPIWPIEINRVGIWPPVRMINMAEMRAMNDGMDAGLRWVFP